MHCGSFVTGILICYTCYGNIDALENPVQRVIKSSSQQTFSYYNLFTNFNDNKKSGLLPYDQISFGSAV